MDYEENGRYDGMLSLHLLTGRSFPPFLYLSQQRVWWLMLVDVEQMSRVMSVTEAPRLVQPSVMMTIQPSVKTAIAEVVIGVPLLMVAWTLGMMFR